MYNLTAKRGHMIELILGILLLISAAAQGNTETAVVPAAPAAAIETELETVQAPDVITDMSPETLAVAPAPVAQIQTNIEACAERYVREPVDAPSCTVLVTPEPTVEGVGLPGVPGECFRFPNGACVPFPPLLPPGVPESTIPPPPDFGG